MTWRLGMSAEVGEAPAKARLLAYDDFTRKTDAVFGASQVMDSGHVWSRTFSTGATTPDPDNLRFEGGRLVLKDDAASYIYHVFADEIDAISLEFEFTDGVWGTNGLTVCVSDRTNPTGISLGLNVAQHSCHLGIGAAHMGLSFFEDEAHVADATYWYDGGTSQNPQFLTPGAPYRVTMRRVGHDRILINAPDGGEWEVRDRRIQTNWGRSVLIEHYQPASPVSEPGYPNEKYAKMLRVQVEKGGHRVAATDLFAGSVGLPGASVTTMFVGSLGAGSIRYTPIVVTEPIQVTAGQVDITTLAGSPGGKMHGAIYVADSAMQPKRRVLNMGEIGIGSDDVLGVVQFPAFTPTIIRPGRYLVRHHASIAASYRIPQYTVPGISNVKSAGGASWGVQALTATAAYVATPEDPGTAWGSALGAATPWLGPITLSWTSSD